MKKILFSVLVLSVMLIYPVSSYALFDAEVYGGYTFSGKIEDDSTSEDGDELKGFAYGFRGHINSSFAAIQMGIGLFIQYSPMEYEIGDETVEMKRSNQGIDGYLKLNLPLMPLKPYLRAGLTVHDRTKFEYDNESDSETKWFKSMYYGGGLAVSILPLPVMSVQLFAEYLYNKGELSSDADVKSHTINVGALASL